MADRESRKRKQRDYKALHEFSTADIYQVNEKKRYRPKSKIFQVERLPSKRKSGKVSTKCLFKSCCSKASFFADRFTSYLFSHRRLSTLSSGKDGPCHRVPGSLPFIYLKSLSGEMNYYHNNIIFQFIMLKGIESLKKLW